MDITPEYINRLLIDEDIEGFIALGAPDDEYSSEATLIADAINRLPQTQFTEENITAIIIVVWAAFELWPEDLKLRAPYIHNVVQRIMHDHTSE
jgi:hypothetical protein